MNQDMNQNTVYMGQPPKQKSVGFSVASLILGIFGLLCCCLGPVSLLIGLLGLIFALVGRSQNGSFDALSISGLICSIIALALSAYMTVSMFLTLSDPTFWAEYEKMLNDMMASAEQMPALRLR